MLRKLDNYDLPLIILEMANNHMGDVDHGIKMIEQFAKVTKQYRDIFNFAWKFQFRDIPTFIHPTFKERKDLSYVSRFQETYLNREQFQILYDCVRKHNFIAICTPFDEKSVDLIVDMKFDIIKIASCSLTDWPLLNKIVETNLPIIASTAGYSFDDIEKVVNFLQNRSKNFAIMHCIGEYPTAEENFELNQIDRLRELYPDVSIGFSTHEPPVYKSSAQIAIAKGALILEKHVAIEEKYKRNAYSAIPSEIDIWLQNIKQALNMCGCLDGRHVIREKEKSDLNQFRRGIYANRYIKQGELISRELSDVLIAWPNVENQLVANDMSKYTSFIAKHDIKKNDPIFNFDVEISNQREKLLNIAKILRDFILKSNIMIPDKSALEISHHYGIDKFFETGIAMITIVNRGYCKKLIIVLPEQNHPEQYHKQKEETFVVLYGSVDLVLDGKLKTYEKGSVITIEPETRHAFSSKDGCVIEEISSTHFKDDSYYTDESIIKNQNRKTFISHWRNAWNFRTML
jgi:sialic acid synthase SpsE/mannose-6-phosphate isomerase-like protein (cupin superfamily)